MFIIHLFSLLVSFQAQKFTALDNQKVNRLSSPVFSQSGGIVYSVRVWDPITSKIGSYIQTTQIKSKQTTNITNLQFGIQDSNPLISQVYQNTIFFLSNRSGKNQIWYKKTDDNSEPKQLTNYQIDIDNLKISNDGKVFFFSSEVYVDCQNTACTQQRDQEIQQRGSNTYHVYDQLFVRHWDRWLDGKFSHIFSQNLQDLLLQSNIEPLDLLTNMSGNSPVPPDGGQEMFDISNDGQKMVFTFQQHAKNESWSTSWQIYENRNGQIVHISSYNQARNQNPKYSPNEKKIAHLCATRPGYESDQNRLCIYDKTTNNVDLGFNFVDLHIEDFDWVDDERINFIATVSGINTLFQFNINDRNNTLKKLFNDNITSINQAPLKIPRREIYIVKSSSFMRPDEFNILNQGKFSLLKNINPQIQGFNMSMPEPFTFQNKNDTIQGWAIKPTNFNSSQKYPLAYLIHGGPESPWMSTWSFRWNPQIFTNDGLAVLMINPHGSPGQGQKFTDAVINDWGGVPYQDIMQGFYNSRQFDWIDTHRACALGASYGGYMVNWIQGNTDAFKCLVTHDGVFSALSMFYSTEEIWFNMAESCPLGQPNCKPYDQQYRQNYFKFSPETKVANFQTPHLVIHGSKDFRIPISEGISLFTALQLQNVPSKLLHFTEENHWVLKAENSIKWYDEVLNWVHQYTNITQQNIEDFDLRNY